MQAHGRQEQLQAEQAQVLMVQAQLAALEREARRMQWENRWLRVQLFLLGTDAVGGSLVIMAYCLLVAWVTYCYPSEWVWSALVCWLPPLPTYFLPVPVAVAAKVVQPETSLGARMWAIMAYTFSTALSFYILPHHPLHARFMLFTPVALLLSNLFAMVVAELYRRATAPDIPVVERVDVWIGVACIPLLAVVLLLVRYLLSINIGFE
jgi:hypothetical protein